MHFKIFELLKIVYLGGLFDDAPMGEVPSVDQPLQEPPQPPDSDDDMDHFGGPPSMGGVRYVL